MAPSRADDVDDDPVTAEYDVYITPELTEKLFLVQFPTRERESPYNEARRNKPLEMRLKPLSGFVELDVPINPHFNYEDGKAKVWGEALDKAKEEGAHGYGMAAGLRNLAGFRAPAAQRAGPGARRRGAEEGQDVDMDRDEDDDEAPRGLQHQTLGGQIIGHEPGKPTYMVGAFRGNELHLTALSGVVQMRPQFHHIDAAAQVERNRARREREAAEPPRAVEPRIVQMMAKSAADVDGHVDGPSARELLQAAQDESWTRLEYRDEEIEEAYEAYHEKMFLQDTEAAPDLVSSMTAEEYLDAVSVPRLDHSGKPRKKPPARRQKVRIEVPDDSSSAHENEGEPTSEAGGQESG